MNENPYASPAEQCGECRRPRWLRFGWVEMWALMCVFVSYALAGHLESIVRQRSIVSALWAVAGSWLLVDTYIKFRRYVRIRIESDRLDIQR